MQTKIDLLKDTEFVIVGLTLDGSPYLPPEWAERLCESLAKSGSDGRKIRPSYARPMIIEGVKCVVVRASLRRDNAAAYALISRYISDNRLMVRPGRCHDEINECVGGSPVIVAERRDTKNDLW